MCVGMDGWMGRAHFLLVVGLGSPNLIIDLHTSINTYDKLVIVKRVGLDFCKALQQARLGKGTSSGGSQHTNTVVVVMDGLIERR